MRKSATMSTTTSMPTSPTLSTKTISSSRISLNSSNFGRSFHSVRFGRNTTIIYNNNNSNNNNNKNCSNNNNNTTGATGITNTTTTATNKPKKKAEESETILEKAKLCVSVFLGAVAMFSVITFLCLIPFVMDPAISTIIANYDPVPVTCIVVEHLYLEGMRNCTWSSCKEGCTSMLTKCHQLYVNYTKIPFSEWEQSPRDLSAVKWDAGYTKFYINSGGCGYPPTTNCTVFAKQYGYSHIGVPFPCYYSRTYLDNVVERFSWENNLTNLLLSMIIPCVLFGSSVGVLSYWYCPCCDKRRTRSPMLFANKFPIKEESISRTETISEKSTRTPIKPAGT